MTNKERFWANVLVKGPNDCWPWTAGVTVQGYGQFYIDGKTERAHRLVLKWEGRLPRGLQGLHTCDNPSCCNPSHLYAGSDADNKRDVIARRRKAGQRNPAAKLTEKDALTILMSADSQAELARRFGIHKSTVSSIKTGKRWMHLQRGTATGACA